jgi:Ni,Fe-hydrogenase III small subunit/ferredoxin-like protein FixX
MADWVAKGLRTGIRSSFYPRRVEVDAGISPGMPADSALKSSSDAEMLASICPTRAIVAHNSAVAVDKGRCVHCFRCGNTGQSSMIAWDPGFEWATDADANTAVQQLQRVFGRSLHIRFVDAGACGACMSEARQLNNPYYNMHRLGFFITPTPRNADVLLVAGPVSDAMRVPLRKTYAAMPPPKRVVAIGACAISGGVFGPSFAASPGVQEVIPVDVIVPGCPPPPLAILHGFLVVVGRKPPAPHSVFAVPTEGSGE